MSSKRKMPSLGLERRVRPRREDKWAPEPEVEDQSSGDDDSEVSEEGIGGPSREEDSGSEDSEAGSESDEEPAAPTTDLSSISFGALARAQASLPKLSEKSTKDDLDSVSDTEPHHFHDASKRRSSSKKDMKRSSKHAPQEQTSKKPVSRRREIIPTENRRAPARDPRFDTTVGGTIRPQDEARTSKAYAFLDAYRDSELADLKSQVKKTKDPELKEDLKRQVLSIESRRKAKKKRDEQDAVLNGHRMKEKELVAQGKKPFYLKKAAQKEQALTTRFEGMSKGQRDKAIERRRKKVSGREKKELGDFLERRQR